MTQPSKGLFHCHHPNVSSIVLWDSPLMKRSFIASGNSGQRTVAPHSHRSSIRLTMLRGALIHYLFVPSSYGQVTQKHTYRSVLLGGSGFSADFEEVPMAIHSRQMTPGDKIILSYQDIHTVEWNADAVWIVDEGPLMTEETTVLVRPGKDNLTTEGLYRPMSQEEYLQHFDLVWQLMADRM